MGKIFLYGRTEPVIRTDPYAKLTVNCPTNMLVRVESADSLTKLDVNSGSAGKAVFDKLEQGKWNVTFLNVAYPPTQQVNIDGLDFEMTLEPVAAARYAMRSIRPVDEGSIAAIAESFSAIIRVSYPEGYVCTCSNTNTTLTATDTSGYYEFVVPCFGDWTIACMDDKHSRSTVVSVSDDDQIEDVTLTYTTYLYDKGIEYIAWNAKNQNGAVRKEQDSIIFNADTMQSSQFGPSYVTATKQDLTNVNMINVNCVSSTASDHCFTLCIRDNTIEVDNFEEDCVAYVQLRNATGVLSLDVSNFTGSYFIELHYSSQGTSTGVIDSVYYI